VSGVGVHVLTFGLADRLEVLTARELKKANKSAVSKAGTKGRSLVRAKTPVKSGLSKAGIRKTTKSAGGAASARIFPGGPHAHVTRWQDQGTGERHKQDGQSTGMVSPQYMFERSAAELEGWFPVIMDAEVAAAIVRSGLG
jgi:hypothetical protein